MSGYRRSFPKGASERMCALMSEARNISELKRAQCIYFRSEHGLPPQQIADMVGFDVGTVRNAGAGLRDPRTGAQTVGHEAGRYHAYLVEELRPKPWLEPFRDAGENVAAFWYRSAGSRRLSLEKVGRQGYRRRTDDDRFTITADGRSRRAPVLWKSDQDAAAPKKTAANIVAEDKAETAACERATYGLSAHDEARYDADVQAIWSPKRTRPTVRSRRMNTLCLWRQSSTAPFLPARHDRRRHERVPRRTGPSA